MLQTTQEAVPSWAAVALHLLRIVYIEALHTQVAAASSPGPAYSTGGNARVVFVPDTPAVQSLVTRVAMAVSCPSEPYKRVCSSSSITTFACLFGVREAPAGCQVGGTTGTAVLQGYRRDNCHAAAAAAA